MNFYQRMEILPLKKRVNRDKCSFTTKQCMFGVFAIDEPGSSVRALYATLPFTRNRSSPSLSLEQLQEKWSQNYDLNYVVIGSFILCVYICISRYYCRAWLGNCILCVCICVCPLIPADTGWETESRSGRPSWWRGGWSQKALRNTCKMVILKHHKNWECCQVTVRHLYFLKMFDLWRRRGMEKEKEGKLGHGKHLYHGGKQKWIGEKRKIFWQGKI